MRSIKIGFKAIVSITLAIGCWGTFALLFFAPPVHADETSPVLVQELEDLRAGLVQAFEKRDTDAMLSFTTPDIVVTWQNGEVTKGKEELRQFSDRMLAGPASIVSKVEGAPSIDGRKVYGDHIISYGHMNDKFTLRGTDEVMNFDSRFSALIVRQEGKLLLAGLHLSVNAFNNPVLDGAIAFSKKILIGGGILGLILGTILGALLFGRKKAKS